MAKPKEKRDPLWIREARAIMDEMERNPPSEEELAPFRTKNWIEKGRGFLGIKHLACLALVVLLAGCLGRGNDVNLHELRVLDADATMRSGSPNRSASRQTSAFGHSTGGGRSFGSPSGVPASTHRTIVSICSSLSDRSFLNSRIPTVRSMCHGGIVRSVTRRLIALAHGCVSS